MHIFIPLTSARQIYACSSYFIKNLWNADFNYKNISLEQFCPSIKHIKKKTQQATSYVVNKIKI